jgi:hypothetical protein
VRALALVWWDWEVPYQNGKKECEVPKRNSNEGINLFSLWRRAVRAPDTPNEANKREDIVRDK